MTSLLLPFLTLHRQAFELQLKNTVRSLVKIRMDYLEGRTEDLLEAVSAEHFTNDIRHNLHKLLNEAKNALPYSACKRSSLNRLKQWC